MKAFVLILCILGAAIIGYQAREWKEGFQIYRIEVRRNGVVYAKGNLYQVTAVKLVNYSGGRK